MSRGSGRRAAHLRVGSAAAASFWLSERCLFFLGGPPAPCACCMSSRICSSDTTCGKLQHGTDAFGRVGLAAAGPPSCCWRWRESGGDSAATACRPICVEAGMLRVPAAQGLGLGRNLSSDSTMGLGGAAHLGKSQLVQPALVLLHTTLALQLILGERHGAAIPRQIWYRSGGRGVDLPQPT